MPGATYAELRVYADSRFGSGSPATWWLGALLVLPGQDGLGGVEPTGIGSYARLAVTNNATNLTAATTVGTETKKVNGVALALPNPTADWGLTIGWAWFDALTGGNLRWFDRLEDGVTPKSGLSPVQFDPGQLIMRFSGSG